MGGLLRMDYDAASADRCAGIRAVGSAQLIVIHSGATGPVPNLEAELVHAAAPSHSTVNGGENEAVTPGIVHGA